MAGREDALRHQDFAQWWDGLAGLSPLLLGDGVLELLRSDESVGEQDLAQALVHRGGLRFHRGVGGAHAPQPEVLQSVTRTAVFRVQGEDTFETVALLAGIVHEFVEQQPCRNTGRGGQHDRTHQLIGRGAIAPAPRLFRSVETGVIHAVLHGVDGDGCPARSCTRAPTTFILERSVNAPQHQATARSLLPG